jgi:hypothetical protein
MSRGKFRRRERIFVFKQCLAGIARDRGSNKFPRKD